MCHTQANVALPQPGQADRITEAGVTAYASGHGTSDCRIVIIPDIYGATPFYRGLATWYVDSGASVFLLDPFAPFGELPEVTREAAFARRAKLRDRTYVGAIESSARQHETTGVVGLLPGRALCLRARASRPASHAGQPLRLSSGHARCRVRRSHGIRGISDPAALGRLKAPLACAGAYVNVSIFDVERPSEVTPLVAHPSALRI